MKRKGLKRILVLSILINICFVGILLSQNTWVSKVNGKKLSHGEFKDYYNGLLYFQVMSSPIPVTRAQLSKILKDKDQMQAFLHTYEDEYLIAQKAKEKKTYNSKEVDRQVAMISKVVKNKLILKSFLSKYIYPKVKVTSKEVQKVYAAELKRKNSPYKRISKKDGIKAIGNQIKGQKALEKLKSYASKLRLAAEIEHNPVLIK